MSDVQYHNHKSYNWHNNTDNSKFFNHNYIDGVFADLELQFEHISMTVIWNTFLVNTPKYLHVDIEK